MNIDEDKTHVAYCASMQNLSNNTSSTLAYGLLDNVTGEYREMAARPGLHEPACNQSHHERCP